MKNLPNILLIEEDFCLRKTTRFLLERIGFNVRDVANKIEANELVESMDPGIVENQLVVLNEEQNSIDELELLALNFKLAGVAVSN